LLIIDGVADLCSDVNSIEQSNLLVSTLMRISTQYKVHIITVIHQNYGSQKLGTGHLGSALEKKAETVVSLEANTMNKGWVTVKCGRSRGYSFETFSFEVNEKGLPTIVNDLYDPLK
jgi:RecA-family ATPase